MHSLASLEDFPRKDVYKRQIFGCPIRAGQGSAGRVQPLRRELPQSACGDCGAGRSEPHFAGKPLVGTGPVSYTHLGLTACGGGSTPTTAETKAEAKTEAKAEPAGEQSAAESKEEAKTTGGKLVVYSPNSEGIMNNVIPGFEEKYGIEVEVISDVYKRQVL